MTQEMKVGVMQPYFLPYLGYFQLIAACDKFVLFDDVNFINKGWVNRNQFLISGAPFMITIPLEKASQNRKINEIMISGEKSWRVKLIKQVENNYRKAPFFDPIFIMMERWLELSSISIGELNRVSITDICEYCGIKTQIVPTSSVYANDELKGQQRVVDICLQEKATTYLNPIGGMELYQSEVFKAVGMHLFFVKGKLSPYLQSTKEFFPGLSILDLLMNLSPQDIQQKLKEITLVTN